MSERRLGGLARDLARGALAGLCGGMAMLLLSLVLRVTAGIPLPVELISDRIVPLLSIGRFLRLARSLGGLEAAKGVAFFSSLGVILAAGVAGGVVLALVARRGSLRRAVLAVGALVLILWIAATILLWPTLQANALGLGSTWATWTNAAALILELSAYLVVLRSVGVWVAPEWRLAPAVGVSGGVAVGSDGSLSRRAALVAGGLGVAAVATGGLAQLLRRRATFPPYGYDGLQLRGPDLDPVTPVERFYVVTKNLFDPRVDAGLWTLEVDGLVDRPAGFGYREIQRLPSIEQPTTLECISNPVGGGLISNAVWRGVSLPDLLQRVGVRPEARVVALHGADGYLHTVSMDKAMERTTLVAHEMNGAPLTLRHGFPARLIVPGTYGEVSVKWIQRIEVTRASPEGYYERQGWRPGFVRTMSRIDRPARGSRVPVGRETEVGGIAFAGDRGISGVDVSTDGGSTWSPALIRYAPNRTTWAMWTFAWRPDRAGPATMLVRATDGGGQLQSDVVRSSPPSGAQGYHAVPIVVG